VPNKGNLTAKSVNDSLYTRIVRVSSVLAWFSYTLFVYMTQLSLLWWLAPASRVDLCCTHGRYNSQSLYEDLQCSWVFLL